jgi:hypothetical protein
MTSKLLIAIVGVIASAPLLAQNAAPPKLPPGMPGMQDPQAMMAAYEAAQAAASQPGDEELSCDELQAQFTEVSNDPALKAKIETAGAAAQSKMAAMQKAQAAAAGSTAASAAASMAPGGQWAALGAAAAQAEASKAAATGHMQQNAALAQDATEMMPKLMRGQRLAELATAKQCEWIAGALPAGMTGTDPNPDPGG